mgnify:FL=1
MTEARYPLATALGVALHDQGFGCNTYRCSLGRGSSAAAHEQDARFLADAILAALPDGWVLARRQDAEDGAALRELYGVNRVNSVDLWSTKRGDGDGVWHVTTFDIKGHSLVGATAPTVAAAARKAREALP